MPVGSMYNFRRKYGVEYRILFPRLMVDVVHDYSFFVYILCFLIDLAGTIFTENKRCVKVDHTRMTLQGRQILTCGWALELYIYKYISYTFYPNGSGLVVFQCMRYYCIRFFFSVIFFSLFKSIK